MDHLADYPNLHAISVGTIAGNFREWPAVRGELNRFLADVIGMEQDYHDLQKESNGWLDKELRLTAERDRYKTALERIAGYDFSAFAGIEGPVGLAKEALTPPKGESI